MKRIFCGLAFGALLVSAAHAQLSLSIGSGDGSLSYTKIYPSGHVDGDDATYNPVGAEAANTTIWNLGFAFWDGTTILYADKDFTGHNQVTVGTPGTGGGSSFTSSNITFTGIANLTASLNVALSQPVANDVARTNWTWTFNNSGGAAINLRVLYFLDVDSYFVSNAYDDDRTVLVSSVTGHTFGNPMGGIAVGETVAGGVDLDNGVLMDSNKPLTGIYGIADPATGAYGSSYYWSSQNSYAATGPQASNSYSIPNTIKNTTQNDGNADFLSDAGGDCAGVMQVDLVIPASGSNNVMFSAIWGLNSDALAGNYSSSVNDWSIY